MFSKVFFLGVIKSWDCVVRSYIASMVSLPFPKRQIKDPLKVFADDNFKLDGNGRKSLKRVENTVRKGEIAS